LCLLRIYFFSLNGRWVPVLWVELHGNFTSFHSRIILRSSVEKFYSLFMNSIVTRKFVDHRSFTKEM